MHVGTNRTVLTFRVVVVGDNRRAPVFHLRLARRPQIGQLLELPPRGGLVTVVLGLSTEHEEIDGVLLALPGRPRA